MLPYSRGLILDNTNNYGIVKTEAVFGFGQRNRENFVSYNATEPLEWLLTPVSVERRSLQATTESPRLWTDVASKFKHTKRQAKNKPKKKRREGKKKCIVKFLNKGGTGDGQTAMGKRRRRRRKPQFRKKMLLPLILGLLAAKSVLIPVALKALAFMSVKGFMMGFFSTILASFLSLKGMFDHSHRYQDRKDDKTQVEIIQVPSKNEHINHYYDDFKRHDLKPEDIKLLPFQGSFHQ